MDTYTAVVRLTEAGMTEPQATAIVSSVRLAVDDGVATKADLANLATKAELTTAIANLATKAELTTAIASLATKAELTTAIASLATKAELTTAIASLATKAELTTAMANLTTAMANLKAEMTRLVLITSGAIIGTMVALTKL